MKLGFAAMLIASLVLCGCGLFRKREPAHPPLPEADAALLRTNSAALPPIEPAPKLIVTPGSGVTGTVAVYNEAGHFVVIDFPLGRVPSPDQKMFVYRNGSKVGEVKITGPQKENHTVADLSQGEAQAGDEIRDK